MSLNTYFSDVCALANETGNCEAYIPSYYYDHEIGQCRQFIWGGCGGNKNRFSSREECEAQCSAQGRVFHSIVMMLLWANSGNGSSALD